MYKQFIEFYLDNFGIIDIIIDVICLTGIILYVTLNNRKSLYPNILNLLTISILFWVIVFWHYFGEQKMLLEFYEQPFIRLLVNIALTFLMGYIIITILRAVMDSILANLSQWNVYSLYEQPKSLSFGGITTSTLVLLFYCFNVMLCATLIIPNEVFTFIGAEDAFLIQIQYIVGDLTYIIIHNPSTLMDYLKAMIV